MADRAPNINRSKLHEDLVQRLSMVNIPGSDRKLFPTIRELLCFAALLGFSEQRRVPLDRSAGVEDISYQQFERDSAAEDLLWTIAVAETQDTEVLRDGEEARCATIFEEYANGGFEIITEWLNKLPTDVSGVKALLAGMENSDFLVQNNDDIKEVEL